MSETRVVHLRRDHFDVRIDRRSPWGNPFMIPQDGDRNEVIAKFRDYVLARPDLLAALDQLRGKTLGCWCAPAGGVTAADLPWVCHGQVLAALADAIVELPSPPMDAEAFQIAEDTVARGQHTFLEVGRALLNIRDGRGYRHAGFTSWEMYLTQRWPAIGRTHAYHLMQAADAVDSVLPGAHCEVPALDFKHAVFLAPLAVDERRALAADENFASTPIAELYRRRREARQKLEQLSVAIATQRARTRSHPPVTLGVTPVTHDDEVRVGLAEQLPWDDSSIDLVITSPPYCLGMEYADGGDYDDYDAYLDLVGRWSRELLRVSHPDHGRLCLDVPIDTDRGGWRPVAHHWQTALEAAGWQYRTQIVWNKGQAGSGTDRGSLDSAATPNVTAPVELVLVYFCGTWSRAVEMHDRQSDLAHADWLQWCGPRGVWDFTGEHDPGHPAVFPDELARRCLKLFSLVGDVVGDPFCGRGTTARISARLGRHVRAVDRSPLYVARTQAEIAAARGHAQLEAVA